MVLKKVMVWSEVPEDVCDSVLSDMIMKTETLASNETGMTPQDATCQHYWYYWVNYNCVKTIYFVIKLCS